jgi:hypothetical protein
MTSALAFLAPELLLEIGEYLPIADTASLVRVCLRFHALFSPHLDAFLRDKRPRTLYPNGLGDAYVTNLQWAAYQGKPLMVGKLLGMGCWDVDDIPESCACTWAVRRPMKQLCRMCACMLGADFAGRGKDYVEVRGILERFRERGSNGKIGRE